MTKYLLAATVLLALATATTSNLWLKTRDRLVREQLRAEQLDGQLTALRERSDRAAKARNEGEQLRAEVRNASNSSEWGAAGVPSDVHIRLCSRTACAEAVKMQSPDN